MLRRLHCRERPRYASSIPSCQSWPASNFADGVLHGASLCQPPYPRPGPCAKPTDDERQRPVHVEQPWKKVICRVQASSAPIHSSTRQHSCPASSWAFARASQLSATCSQAFRSSSLPAAAACRRARFASSWYRAIVSIGSPEYCSPSRCVVYPT